MIIHRNDPNHCIESHEEKSKRSFSQAPRPNSNNDAKLRTDASVITDVTCNVEIGLAKLVVPFLPEGRNPLYTRNIPTKMSTWTQNPRRET